jgi:SAM-dependent methyltransferase
MPDKSFTWLRNTEEVTADNMEVDTELTFSQVDDSSNLRYNRILNNGARDMYSDVIRQLQYAFPLTMSKKIAEANVQQAFVLDTVYRNLKNYDNPKMLCVGSYEDTASMYLRKMGYQVEEIDPMINYYLQEFVDKPSVISNSYNIIFSTSVIEHDPDDESFIKSIDKLLAPGGIAIITCDYNDFWKPGDLKPEVDARLYTQRPKG